MAPILRKYHGFHVQERALHEKGDTMAPVLELDRQTASFVRQLEEQRKLEKTLLVERVRGTKEGLESVFSDIKSRVAVLEKLKRVGECQLYCADRLEQTDLYRSG